MNNNRNEKIYIINTRNNGEKREEVNESVLISSDEDSSDSMMPKQLRNQTNARNNHKPSLAKTIKKCNTPQVSGDRSILKYILLKNLNCESDKMLKLPETNGNKEENSVKIGSNSSLNYPLCSQGNSHYQISSGVMSNQMPQIQGNLGTSTINPSLAFNGEKNFKPHDPPILIAKIIDPITPPSVQSSVSLSIHDSTPQMLSQHPVSINLLLPNTQMSGSNLINQPISTSNNILSHQLVLIEPPVNQSFSTPLNSISNVQGAYSNINARGVYSNINAQGAYSNINAQGAYSNINAQGAYSNINAQGAYSNINAQGAYSNINAQGAYSNINAQGAYSNINAQGVYSNINAQGAYSNVHTQGVFTNVHTQVAYNNVKQVDPQLVLMHTSYNYEQPLLQKTTLNSENCFQLSNQAVVQSTVNNSITCGPNFNVLPCVNNSTMGLGNENNSSSILQNSTSIFKIQNSSTQEVCVGTSRDPVHLKASQSEVSFQTYAPSMMQPNITFTKDLSKIKFQNTKNDIGSFEIIDAHNKSQQPKMRQITLTKQLKLFQKNALKYQGTQSLKESSSNLSQLEINPPTDGALCQLPKNNVANKIPNSNSLFQMKTKKSVVTESSLCRSSRTSPLVKAISESKAVVSPVSRVTRNVWSLRASEEGGQVQDITTHRMIKENAMKDKEKTNCSKVVIVSDSSDEDQLGVETPLHSSNSISKELYKSSVFSLHQVKPKMSIEIDASIQQPCNSSIDTNTKIGRVDDESNKNFFCLDIIKEECDQARDEKSGSVISFQESQSDIRSEILRDIAINNDIVEDDHVAIMEENGFKRDLSNKRVILNRQIMIKNHNEVMDCVVESHNVNSGGTNNNSHVKSDKEECTVKPYICPHCGFSVAMKKNMEMHIKSFHSNNELENPNLKKISLNNTQTQSEITCLSIEKNVFKCSECNLCTDGSLNLNKHLIMEHDIYPCSKCSYACEGAENLRLHDISHKNVQCSYCNVIIPLAEFDSHLSNCYNGYYRYKCNHCNYRTTIKWVFKYHLLCKHKDKMDSQQNYVSVQKKNKLVDDDSDTDWIFDEDLSDSEDSENENEPWSTNEKRIIGQRCHYLCKVCGFRAASEESLANHQQNHFQVDSNSHNCSYCSFEAKTSSELRSHKHLAHSEKFPFICKECTVRYSRNSSLRDHIKFCHKMNDSYIKKRGSGLAPKKITTQNYSNSNESTEEVKSSSSFKCRFCDFKCDKKKLLDEHRYKTHGGNLIFSCRLCIFRCTHLFKLRRHEKNVHKIFTKNSILYKCSICKFQANEKYILSLHKLKVHQSKCNLKCNECSYRASTSNLLRKHCLFVHYKIYQTATIKKFSRKLDCSIPIDTEVSVEKQCSLNSASSEFNEPSDSLCTSQDFRSKKFINADQEVESDIFLYHCEVCNYKNNLLTEFQRHIISNHDKYYECTTCLFVFDSLDKLFTHYSQFHYHIYEFRCCHCNFCCTSEDNLRIHLKNMHLPATCYYCNLNVLDSLRLNQHIENYHSDRVPLKCGKCGYQSMKEEFLFMHVKKMHNLVQCSYCSVDLESMSELFAHTSLNHSSDLPHQCKICSLRMKTPFLLKIHVERFHNLKCTVCALDVPTSEKLYQHIYQYHPSTYLLQCLMCSISFKSSEMLIMHEINIHNKRTFRCRGCPYFTDSLEYLSIHINDSHKTSKVNSIVNSEFSKFSKMKKCRLCGVKFGSIDQLYTHYSVAHSKRYSWKCSYCPFRTTRSFHLRTHEKKCHDKVYYFFCQYCFFKADSKFKVTEHERFTHKDVFVYHCSSCSYSAKKSQMKYLKRHVFEYHSRDIDSDESKPALQCSQCTFWTRKKTTLKSHVKRFHESNVNKKKYIFNDQVPNIASKENSNSHSPTSPCEEGLSSTEKRILEESDKVDSCKPIIFDHMLCDNLSNKNMSLRSSSDIDSVDAAILQRYPEIQQCYVVISDIRHSNKDLVKSKEHCS